MSFAIKNLQAGRHDGVLSISPFFILSSEWPLWEKYVQVIDGLICLKMQKNLPRSILAPTWVKWKIVWCRLNNLPNYWIFFFSSQDESHLEKINYKSSRKLWQDGVNFTLLAEKTLEDICSCFVKKCFPWNWLSWGKLCFKEANLFS